jgi:hypothetical protein
LKSWYYNKKLSLTIITELPYYSIHFQSLCVVTSSTLLMSTGLSRVSSIFWSLRSLMQPIILTFWRGNLSSHVVHIYTLWISGQDWYCFSKYFLKSFNYYAWSFFNFVYNVFFILCHTWKKYKLRTVIFGCAKHILTFNQDFIS